MADVRAALSLLPRGAITGIGSLPHTQMELALQMALAVDVPYLPQLPSQNPSELMVPAALEGLPGLEAGEDGACTVELGAWEAGRAALEARIDAAVRSGDASAFLPGVAAARALRPFLWEARERKLAFAKAQLAGPATVRWSSRLSTGEPLSEHPGLDAQVFRLLLVRSLALVQAVRAAGATAIFYLDEPGLYALDTTDPAHLAALTEIRLLVAALRQQGALVGLHCCGNTRWSALLDLGIDLLSFDVRLSRRGLLAGARPDRSGPGGGPGGAGQGRGDLVRGGASGPAGRAPSLRDHAGLRAGDAYRARGRANLRAAPGGQVRPDALSSPARNSRRTAHARPVPSSRRRVRPRTRCGPRSRRPAGQSARAPGKDAS
jgi:hypothetical protein